MPGKVSWAHHGVRFLDELPECRGHVIEMLRQLQRSALHRDRLEGLTEFATVAMLVTRYRPRVPERHHLLRLQSHGSVEGTSPARSSHTITRFGKMEAGERAYVLSVPPS
jgi:Magnesium chelatase, subunit ChlI